jgi:hypothetical protein
MVFSAATFQRRGDPAAPEQWACFIDEALAAAGVDPMAQFDMVIDTFGFQYTLNMNIKPFVNLAQALDIYFAERVHRFVCLDMPMAAIQIFNVVKPLLDPKTALKVVFAKRSDPASMEMVLYDLCKDDAMRRHVEALLSVNTQDCERQPHHKRDRAKYVAMLKDMVDAYRRESGEKCGEKCVDNLSALERLEIRVGQFMSASKTAGM